jgi:hypothetical protein
MLDLDGPRTQHVFAASKQLDLMFDYLKRISYAESKSRLFMLEVIRPCFAALRWLQLERFSDRPHIGAAIDELEQAAEDLAHLGDGAAKWSRYDLPPSHCPVCGYTLHVSPRCEMTEGVYVPENRTCLPCIEVVYEALRRARSGKLGFGTDAI